MTLRLVSTGSPDGLLPLLLSEFTDSGPVAYQFLTPTKRASPWTRAWAKLRRKSRGWCCPPGWRAHRKGRINAPAGGVLTSCLDLRGIDYAYDPVGAKDKPGAWSLPDIHIEDNLSLVAFSQPGALEHVHRRSPAERRRISPRRSTSIPGERK